MVIIGISGRRGVGKSLLASHLVRTCGFLKISFADELKVLARHIFPFGDADFTSPKQKEKPFKTYDWSPREFLVNMGEFVRYHDPNYFVRAALAKMSKDGYFVVDDLRYENEYVVLKNLGAKIIRIERAEKDNPYGKDLDIISESSLDKSEFDYKIEKFRNTSAKELIGHTEAILELFEEKNDE